VYQVRFLDHAATELAALDRAAAQRIVTRLRWLAAHVTELPLEPLAGDLTGLYKLRVGAYRVIYEVLHAERIVLVHAIGHRREVYRRR
jgi:mRNA interferase RelE/StbE